MGRRRTCGAAGLIRFQERAAMRSGLRGLGCRSFVFLAMLCAAAGGASRIDAGQPAPPARFDAQAVARRIDASLATEVFAPANVELAPIADDATFLRRVYLDVIGDIPPPERIAAFLEDSSPDKRQHVVRELLADPRYGVNWARYWRDVIFYRRIEDRALIASQSLVDDLSAALNDNEPWDAIAQEFITATGDVRENGATALLMAQDARTEETAAEVARIFLGVQIQCAQCHDHPYDRWKREQFHELAGFFPRIGVRPTARDMGGRSFEVFANDRARRMVMNNNNNRPVAEHFMPDLENPDAPGTQMRPVFFLTGQQTAFGLPDETRRGRLAEWLTANEWFAKALVNRLWAELVGEGFYEPVDDIGPDRTASAPQTLDQLAEAFRTNGCDLKWLIETIAATEAYQRESRPRRDGAGGAPFAANVPQPLRADVLYDAVLSALELKEPQLRRSRRGGMAGVLRNRGPRGQFNETFGYDPSDPRESIAGSIPQVLAMMNSPQVAGEATARRGSVVGRLRDEVTDDEQLIGALYLRTLSRKPTDAELMTAVAYVEEAGLRSEAFEDLLWALLNSAEFRHRD
jgi:hypothetical protein